MSRVVSCKFVVRHQGDIAYRKCEHIVNASCICDAPRKSNTPNAIQCLSSAMSSQSQSECFSESTTVFWSFGRTKALVKFSGGVQEGGACSAFRTSRTITCQDAIEMRRSGPNARFAPCVCLQPTMSPQSNVETLARIVTALGDDTSRPEDIEWANEMPSGRDMLAWIVSQLSAPEDAVHDDDDILASLSAIALDDDELKLSEYNAMYIHS